LVGVKVVKNHYFGIFLFLSNVLAVLFESSSGTPRTRPARSPNGHRTSLSISMESSASSAGKFSDFKNPGNLSDPSISPARILIGACFASRFGTNLAHFLSPQVL
jgi:hypothetical protein